MIIGIIGGGQLGLMMAEAAKEENHTVIGLDPNDACPLSKIADEMIVGLYNDSDCIEKLSNKCDVITYEFENVDLELVKKYESKIPQKSQALYFSRNRLTEKQFAKNLNIPTARFEKFERNNLFAPSIIKTTTGGYDGKGQWKVNEIEKTDHIPKNNSNEYIIEELIDFDFEISVVATRDSFGNVVFLPIPINEHRNGILFTSSVFNGLDSLIVSKAKDYTYKIIEKLDYVGTLAVEYFVRNKEVIFNEFAPRPHNSGHYSIEGCTVSQFKNHVNAITGEKVCEPKLKKPTIMVNVLGQDDSFTKGLNCDGVYYHDYGKKEKNTDRKMGHITILSDTINEAITTKNNIIKE